MSEQPPENAAELLEAIRKTNPDGSEEEHRDEFCRLANEKIKREVFEFWFDNHHPGA